MRRRLGLVWVGVVLGLCSGVFGLLEAYRAQRLNLQLDGGRRTLALSRQVGEPSALRRRLASQTATRSVLTAHALAARAGVEAFERAMDESLAEAEVEVVSRTPWVGIKEQGGKVGPHAAAFGARLTVRAGFPSLLQIVRSWEGWPDRARLRSVEVRPAGAGQVEAILNLAVVRVLPAAPLVEPETAGGGG